MPKRAKKKPRLHVASLHFDRNFAGPNPRVTLAFGEYVQPANNPGARYVFIQTLWAVVPEALQKLLQIADDQDVDPQKVAHWAKSLNLSDQWILDGALELVRVWQTTRSSRPDPLSRPEDKLPKGIVWSEPVAPLLSWPAPRPWDPLHEIATDYQAYLKRYVLDIRQRATQLGLEPSPVKRNIEHVRWLVRHQVLGESYGQIASDTPDVAVDINTIGEAIQTTANVIGLRLRAASGRQ